VNKREIGTGAKHVSRPLLTEPQITALLFLLPGLIIFVIFVIYPILQSFRFSFFNWNGLGPMDDWVGTRNYERMLNDPIFWRALSNNVLVIVWSLLTQLPLGIGLAILLTGKLKGTGLLRTIYFAPMVFSEVIIATLWGWIYNPQFGLINTFLRGVGLGHLTAGWLGESSTVMVALLIVTTWKYIGFYTLIFIAAIEGISYELYEAARIDGAGGWKIHRYVTLPLLGPTIRMSLVLMIVGSLKFFDIVWVMTEGGPGDTSQVLATYMFKNAFRSQFWGYASALSVTLFVLAFIAAIAFLFISRSQQNAEG
jgi:raffinose/stachyose/melibiose transport system permease protein